jgi:hypothetical protein
MTTHPFRLRPATQAIVSPPASIIIRFDPRVEGPARSSGQAELRPGALVTRLAGEITRYAGHAPDDDIALLAAYRDPA